MKKTLVLITTLGLLSPFAHSIELTPGQWDVTVDMNAPGIPDNMRTRVKQDCLTQEQAGDLEASMRKGWKEDNCGGAEINRSGNTLRWSAVCSMPGSDAKTHISGTMVIHNDKHYTTDITVKGNHHSMKTHSEAKWVGACKEE
ncbi:MAG: hypothetical protein CL537_04730 [Alcanivoracaceae bacterium]|nr:hypothetical protein [Alcanivoracaceae bacterium]MCG8439834.1 DUF3617 domain-containing protein [Pseudomonadales bacterium]|tara:strand:- start:5116 stop:5544 length:429 start_codon:yes stop_codon:yes gene_type:complete